MAAMQQKDRRFQQMNSGGILERLFSLIAEFFRWLLERPIRPRDLVRLIDKPREAFRTLGKSVVAGAFDIGLKYLLTPAIYAVVRAVPFTPYVEFEKQADGRVKCRLGLNVVESERGKTRRQIEQHDGVSANGGKRKNGENIDESVDEVLSDEDNAAL